MRSLRAQVSCFLAVSGFILLWSLSVPLFASPDEPANFVKSAAVIRGELLGDSVAPETLKSYWTTVVDIDPQFGSVNGLPWCFAPFPDKPACTYDVATAPQVDGVAWTNMGKYPPVGFLVTGLGTIFGPTNTSVYAARILQALVCAALLLGAGAVLRRRDQSLVGLVLAVVPGTIFLAATASPSGLEIVAGIALWTVAPLVLSGGSSSLERRLFAIAGVFLIATRPLGLIFYLAGVGVSFFVERVTLLDGVRNVGSRIASLHGVAVGFMVWWYLAIYGPATRTKIDFGDVPLDVRRQMEEIVKGLPRILEQYVGNFGWLDTPAPQAIVTASVALVIGIALLAWRTMGWRVWTSLAFLFSASIAFTVAADLNYYQLLRTFGSQGRHVAPFLVGIPLLIGSRFSRGSRTPFVVFVISGVTVVWSFFVMLRRYSVGVIPGNLSQMWTDPTWTPPLGITGSLVAIIAVTGACVVLLHRAEYSNR
ncbi:MAG: DUF2142 domain-containing protein [Ilumatobacteraceae bacterium]